MGGTFHYLNPPAIHWGQGCVAERLAAELDALGASRVFLVTSGSIAANPAIIEIIEEAAGARLAGRFSAVGQHAPARAVAALAKAAREAKADALLSAGGGSPIDAAKAAAWSLATGIDLADPAASRAARLDGKAVLPQIALPTTLSVAELSGSAGFSAEGSKEKVGVAAPQLVPRAVFYDADLALHTPLDLWLSTGIRAVDHAVETLLASGEHPLPDAAALEALRRLPGALRAAKANSGSAAARTDCQIAAWLSYLLPGPAARGLSHTLGKRLGSRHGIPHGVTSCLLLPHVIRYYQHRKPEPIERMSLALGGSAADVIEQLIADLGLPQRLSSYHLADADLVEAARPVAGEEHSLEQLVAILQSAR